jgi:ABC-type glutathione transport system ATPase component
VSVLQLTDVTVRRGTKTLLDAVTFSVAGGETVALIGRSGAGKSTAVRIALALERPTAGEVRWGDVTPHRLSARALRLARRRVAAVFQQPTSSLDPRQSLSASVGEPLSVHEPGLSRADRQARIDAALERVGLSRALGLRRPNEISGGEAQRVALARALIAQPSLVVLDEPTSALDASAAAGVLNLIRELADERGVAFLIVSHDLAAVAHVAARVAVLEAGRLVESGPTAACFAAPASSALASLLAASAGGPPG